METGRTCAELADTATTPVGFRSLKNAGLPYARLNCSVARLQGEFREVVNLIKYGLASRYVTVVMIHFINTWK